MPASQSQQVRERVSYRYKQRLSDEQVQVASAESLREVALIGPAGTLAFLDTSRCLHYGSRISSPDARRLVIMLQYITPSAFILPDYPAVRPSARWHRRAGTQSSNSCWARPPWPKG